MSVADMVKAMNARAKSLKQLERNFDLELAFLNQRIEAMTKSKVQSMIVGCLPATDAPQSLTQAPGCGRSIGEGRTLEVPEVF